MGSGYNRNAARLVITEVMREHGQQAVDQLTRDLDLEQKFGFRPGTVFTTAGAKTSHPAQGGSQKFTLPRLARTELI